MLDRVEMNVVGAAFEIAVIANGVFPKTFLPKRIFASKKDVPPATKLRRYRTIAAVYPGFRFASSGLRTPASGGKIPCKLRHGERPNSDIENLESRHRRVSISHQVITRN
jgi:hypothetical protein